MDVLKNKKILMAANKIALAVEEEMEEILEHAEQVVKSFVPAKHVKATLNKIEKALDNEGIEALFNKTVTREALRKTASEVVSSKEIDEVVKAILEAIVDEVEDMLEDADDVSDETVKSFDDEDGFESESKLKSLLEKKLAAKGVYTRLARKYKNTTASKKQTLIEKIKSTKNIKK